MAAVQIDSADAGLFFISEEDNFVLLPGNMFEQNYTVFTVEPDVGAEPIKEFWE